MSGRHVGFLMNGDIERKVEDGGINDGENRKRVFAGIRTLLRRKE